MTANDLFYLADEEDGGGFYLVEKNYWNLHKCVCDHEFGKEIWKILPKRQEDTSGFSQTMESYFVYEPNPEEGLEILKSLGITEVFMEN